MNERTKAIGHQAGLVFIEDGVYGQRWYSSRCGLDAAEYQKLVELIVRECVEIAKDVNKNPYLDEHHHARQIIKNITKHFGVTE